MCSNRCGGQRVFRWGSALLITVLLGEGKNVIGSCLEVILNVKCGRGEGERMFRWGSASLITALLGRIEETGKSKSGVGDDFYHRGTTLPITTNHHLREP
jgi:hypothetical protein